MTHIRCEDVKKRESRVFFEDLNFLMGEADFGDRAELIPFD